MKKSISLLVLIFSFLGGSFLLVNAYTYPIKLVSPVGGERWTIGQNYTVTWDYVTTGYQKAEVYLAYSDGRVCHLGSPSIDSESFSFILPDKCASQFWAIIPGDYSINIYPNNGLDDNSDLAGAVYSKKITIVSASNQNPSAINGKCGGADGKVFWNFDEIRAAGICAVGLDSGAQKNNEGAWYWTCMGSFGGKDANCKAGIYYKYPSIVVSTGSVNGNEGWQLNSGHVRFIWEAYSSNKVNIDLCIDQDVNRCSVSVTKELDASKSYYDWYFDPSASYFSGNTLKFKVKISDSSDPNNYGYSRGYIYFIPSTSKINGICGSANNTTVSFAPSINLCSSGTASSVSGSGPWTWTCNGSGGGTIAICSAKKNDSSLPAKCENITGDIDKCLYDEAISEKNASFCDKISKTSLQDGCYSGVAVVLLDTSICKKIKGPHYYDCYYAIVVKKQDSSMCGAITDSWLRDRCYSLTAKDLSVCDKITNQTFKDNCNYRLKAGSNIINGVCGSANGQSFLSAPTTNLCISGTASVIYNSGPWTWYCGGVNGGTTDNCSAKKKIETAMGNFKSKNIDICKENGKPIVYYFGSKYCPHCSWESPILREVIEKFGNTISYHEIIDSKDYEDIFNDYSEGGIPLIVVGCKYYRIGSGEQAGIESEKQTLTKLICETTGNKPTSVCQEQSITLNKSLDQMTREELISLLLTILRTMNIN